MRILLSVLVLFSTFQAILGGSILIWMSLGSKSHFNLVKPLAMELAKRGHSITLVSPYPFKELEAMSNVKYIRVDTDLSTMMNSTDIFEGGNVYDMKKMSDAKDASQDVLMKHPDIKSLIKNKPKFDATIILSPFCHDLGLYLARRTLDSPVIIFFTGLKFSLIDRAMGNTVNPSFIPVEMLGYSQHMTFKERLFNTIVMNIGEAVFSYYMDPAMGEKIKEILHLDEAPDLTSMSGEASFALLNAHPVFESISPINPNTALVGGMHVGPPAPLTGELKKWVEEAKDGVILVSYGSVLTGSHLPEYKRKILINTFSKLKQRVIWKWETEEMANKPANVMLKKWLPQADILGHPNVKLFITHGGLLSTEESLYHKVPMIIMPGFGDQFSNAARSERMGYGRELRWTDLDDTNLLDMIQAVLADKSFQEKADYYGDIFQDNMVSSLDTAVFHTEYIMRHKGAPHLRSPAKDLYWFQFLLLDVMAFLAFVILLALFIVYKMGRFIVRRTCGLFGSSSSSKKVKTN